MGAKQQILYYLVEIFNILWKFFEKIEKISRQGRRPKPKKSRSMALRHERD